MKILLCGSDGDKPTPRLKRAGQTLGTAVARKRHDLILVQPDERCIDPWALKGFLEAGGKHVHLRQGPILDPVPEGALSEWRALEDVFERHQDVVVHPIHCEMSNRSEFLKSVDYVVAIGGRENTKHILEDAKSLGIPRLAIPILEGSAGEHWNKWQKEMVGDSPPLFRTMLASEISLDAALTIIDAISPRSSNDNAAPIVKRGANEAEKRSNPYETIQMPAIFSIVPRWAYYVAGFPAGLLFIVWATLAAVKPVEDACHSTKACQIAIGWLFSDPPSELPPSGTQRTNCPDSLPLEEWLRCAGQ